MQLFLKWKLKYQRIKQRFMKLKSILLRNNHFFKFPKCWNKNTLSQRKNTKMFKANIKLLRLKGELSKKKICKLQKKLPNNCKQRIKS